MSKISFLVVIILSAQGSSAAVLETTVTEQIVRQPQPTELPRNDFVVSDELKVSAEADEIKDLVRHWAAVSDSYNAEGFAQSLSVRGFTLDPRTSYFRNGLPVFGDVPFFGENKDSIELQKGLAAALWSGLAPPGGALNVQTIRPHRKINPFAINTQVSETGSSALALATNQENWSSQLSGGLPKPRYNKGPGYRGLWGVQYEIQSDDLLWGVEFEYSKQSQRSRAPGSVWRTQIPAVPTPELNFNSQSWSQPVEYTQIVGTVYIRHKRFTLTTGIQEVHVKDRFAFGYGCSVENVFDRFCSDGSFDFYDYRSEQEKNWSGSIRLTADLLKSDHHSLSVSALTQKTLERADYRAYNLLGVNDAQGTLPLLANPEKTDKATLRNGQRHQLTLVQNSQWTENFFSSIGLSQLHFERESIRVDGSRPTGYSDHQTLPFAGIGAKTDSFKMMFALTAGFETFVTPQRSSYQNPGQFLRDARSKGQELTAVWKFSEQTLLEGSIFEIDRAHVYDSAPFYQIDGQQIHRGLEVTTKHSLASWTLQFSYQHLNAFYADQMLDTSLAGKAPVNVPQDSLRVNIGWSDKKWKLVGVAEHSSKKFADLENTLSIDPWTVFHLQGSYAFTASSRVSFSIENLFDHRYWRESPTQFSHIYLIPGTERRVSLGYSHLF